MNDLADFWPLARLRVSSGDTELRFPSAADLVALAEVAREGVHDPAYMPFLVPWTDQDPTLRGRSVLQWFWRQCAAWTPEQWSLPMVVVRSGVVVGMQDLKGAQFAVSRRVSTGSYLGLAHQGQGTGTLMRQLALTLAFEGLGAREAHSGAFEDNVASRAVSRKVGYSLNGSTTAVRRLEPVTELRFKLTHGEWMRANRPRAEIEGLDQCRHEFGL